MRLLKKKSGAPTGFAKVLKGVGKVASVAASVAPIPAAGKVGQALGKLSDKLGKKSGGKVNFSGIVPKEGESVKTFFDRQVKGVGGAVEGFTSQNQTAPASNSNLSPLEQGFAQNKILKYAGTGAILAVVGFAIYKLVKR